MNKVTVMKTHLGKNFALAVLVLLFASGRLWAVGEEGISVSGSGEVMAKPNVLEIDLVASGSAELTGDALVKYRSSLQRTLEAFEGLKIKNLKIEQRGLGVENSAAAQAMQMRFNGGGNVPTKSTFDISRSLKLVLRDVNKLSEEELTDTVSKLLDTAKDSGATVGNSTSAAMTMARIYGQQMASSVVTFVVDDLDAVRQQAYTQAFEQAQSRAQRLADLAGAKLGPVISVEESMSVAPDESNGQMRVMAAVYGWQMSQNKQESRVTSEKLADIPISVTLKVRFGIQPGKGAGERAAATR